MIYNLVQDSNGRLISSSSEPILNPSAGRVVIETADNVGIWNESTRVYDPYPASTTILRSRFYSNAGSVQFRKITDSARSNNGIDALLQYISGLDVIQNSDLQVLVTEGVWTQQELNGVLDA